MALLLISGFGLLLLARIEGNTHYLYDPRIWAKMILALILVLNAIAIQSRKISAWLGGAISLVSWYAALIIGAWRSLDVAWWVMLAVYVAAIAVGYVVQDLVRRKMGVKKA